LLLPATLNKSGDLAGNSSHEQYLALFEVVGLSLKQRPKLYCFECSKNDPKEHSFAIIAGKKLH